MALKTYPVDFSEFLDTPEAIAAYLDEVLVAAIEDRNPGLITAALGDVAKAHGMSAIAREAGVARDTLYKALSPDGDPRLSTLLGVVRTLGLSLRVTTKAA